VYCLKAEDFEQKGHKMLDWLTEAERHLRYQGTIPDSEEVLEQHLADHQVSSFVSVGMFTSLLIPLIIRDVSDFGSGSGKSGIRPFFGNPAKSGSSQNFDQIWGSCPVW